MCAFPGVRNLNVPRRYETRGRARDGGLSGGAGCSLMLVAQSFRAEAVLFLWCDMSAELSLFDIYSIPIPGMPDGMGRHGWDTRTCDVQCAVWLLVLVGKQVV